MSDTPTCDVCRVDLDRDYGQYTAEEMGVCNDCWFEELSGNERKMYAKRGNAMKELRLADDTEDDDEDEQSPLERLLDDDTDVDEVTDVYVEDDS